MAREVDHAGTRERTAPARGFAATCAACPGDRLPGLCGNRTATDIDSTCVRLAHGSGGIEAGGSRIGACLLLDRDPDAHWGQAIPIRLTIV